ncbi:MAG: isoprenylcysteine carboxylmethyltransferase family protein [Desulfobacterales bacterium]|nr:MAG: isoprenylcysteine carboxylmethyltransferase family protein [Desulfobacterales bacterium]
MISPLEILNIMNITSVKEYSRNISLALLHAFTLFLLAYGVPYTYEMFSSDKHIVIDQIGKIRFIGPILIVIGIIGCLSCLWNFIFTAKGSPLPGDQKHLIIKGLYRYVRNPMYLSFYLIIFGEALYFQSLDLLLYLSVWIVLCEIRLIFFEERSLKKRFGETYEQYRKSVHRWIPRLTPYRKNDSESQ